MRVAMQLFAEDGYAHTSIDRIAAKAGISKGLIYTYFESKEDLLRQIFLLGIRKVEEAGLFQNEITPDTLVDSMSRMLDMVVEHRDFFRLYTALTTQPGISQKIGQVIDNNREINLLLRYFKTRYGENALNETLLFSTITKGYSILTLFSDAQSVMPVASLKSVVMRFVRERWGSGSQQAEQDGKREKWRTGRVSICRKIKKYIKR